MTTERLGDVLHQVQDPGVQTLFERMNKKETLNQYLTRKYGKGDDPSKRQLLYQRIELAFQLKPELLLALLGEAEMQACLASGTKDRYFCKAMSMKLYEHAEALGLVRKADVDRFRR